MPTNLQKLVTKHDELIADIKATEATQREHLHQGRADNDDPELSIDDVLSRRAAHNAAIVACNERLELTYSRLDSIKTELQEQVTSAEKAHQQAMVAHRTEDRKQGEKLRQSKKYKDAVKLIVTYQFLSDKNGNAMATELFGGDRIRSIDAAKETGYYTSEPEESEEYLKASRLLSAIKEELNEYNLKRVSRGDMMSSVPKTKPPLEETQSTGKGLAPMENRRRPQESFPEKTARIVTDELRKVGALPEKNGADYL